MTTMGRTPEGEEVNTDGHHDERRQSALPGGRWSPVSGRAAASRAAPLNGVGVELQVEPAFEIIVLVERVDSDVRQNAADEGQHRVPRADVRARWRWQRPAQGKRRPGRGSEKEDASHQKWFSYFNPSPDDCIFIFATLTAAEGNSPNRGGLHGAGGQELDEQAAVFLGQNALVEDDDHAAVELGADQAAKALAEAQDGFG